MRVDCNYLKLDFNNRAPLYLAYARELRLCLVTKLAMFPLLHLAMRASCDSKVAQKQGIYTDYYAQN